MSTDVERSAVPGTTKVVRLIAEREVRQRLGAKSFYILTGLLVLVILAIGIIGRVAGSDEPGSIDVGVVDVSAEPFAAALDNIGAQIDRKVDVEAFKDRAAAQAALKDGKVDVVVEGSRGEVLFDGSVDDQINAVVQQAWATVQTSGTLADAGLSDAQIAGALSPKPLTSVVIGDNADNTGLALLTGAVTAVLLFISLQTFGGYVLSGVIEEKSTAVVELLLARVRSDQLLAGKVIGIGVAALVQFTAAVAAGLVSLVISGREVPSEIWSAVPLSLLWFLGGYALYSTLYALAGSLVSRQEDAQAASAPILTVMMGAYFVVFLFGFDPQSRSSTILSLLPPVAPFLMPMRMAAGAASVAEVLLSVLLLLASIYGVWKLAGRIYGQVLLHRGSRITWRSAFGLLRAR